MDFQQPSQTMSPELEAAVAAVLKRMPAAERLAYPLREAADLIGVPERTFRDAYSRGEFVAVKRCGKMLVTRVELLRWLSDCN
jgi:hypothetical protein